MATLFQLPGVAPVFAGSSLAGAQLYFYEAGTTTPISTYTTAALSVAHNHPVVAGADGVFAPIFINDATNATYRVQLYDSADVLKYDRDNMLAASVGIVRFTNGDATAPSITFDSDTNTGVYRVSTDQLGFATGGTYRAQFTLVGFTTDVRIQVPDGSAAAPNYTFNNDLNTGIYLSAADQLSLSAGGAEALRVDTNATATNTRLLIYDVDNGTVERVSVGAADSGGSGFKVLRIPN